MLCNVQSPFTLSFSRAGGALITARVDIWQANPTGWKLVAECEFSKPSVSQEQLNQSLPKGNYAAIFQCYVEESLNGKYSFTFMVDANVVYQDDGDVNTTSAGDDSKVYKDQFALVVQ